MATAASIVKEDRSQLNLLLQRYLKCAHHALEKSRSLGHVNGASKLEKKCMAEVRFLKSLSKRKGGFDVTHLKSSNLSHYLGVIHAAENLPEVTEIFQAFRCPGRTEALHVDVVAGQGGLWVKVVARKAQALHLIWAGQGQYGERDPILQAEDFVTCAKEHPINFKPPSVVFSFYNGVTTSMADALREIGVIVIGQETGVDLSISKKLEHLHFDDSESDEETGSDVSLDGLPRDDVGIATDISRHGEQVAEVSLVLGDDVAGKISDDLSDSSRHQSADNCKHVKVPSEGRLISDNSRCTVCKHFQCRCCANVTEVIRDHEGQGSELTRRSEEFHDGNRQDTCIDSKRCLVQESVKCGYKLNTGKPIITTILEPHSVNSGPATGVTAEATSLPHIDFPDSPEGDTSNKIKLGNETVLPLIEQDLLLHPLADYSVLGPELARCKQNNINEIAKVNLDITALIVLVSSISHGRCYFKFQENILTEQASEERRDPVLPKLEEFLNGKEMFACETAVRSFRSILDTLGGASEKSRANKLLGEVTIVKDDPSFRAQVLPNTGKIKDRSKVVFGTGDNIGAVTVTANSGFVRAAAHQGVLFPVFLHASRALTEEKEKTAEIMNEAELC